VGAEQSSHFAGLPLDVAVMRTHGPPSHKPQVGDAR
jgi:hypothetical protein